MMIKDKAFVIGNGSSRLTFDLNKLDDHGTTFGCNALYRDFIPDYLVSIDPKIIEEITDSDFPQHRFIVPPEHEQYEPVAYSPNRMRSNAGMNCMIEAIKRGHTELFCLGFDFMHTNKEIIRANIYVGTNAYGPETAVSYEDSVKRVAYLDWFASNHTDVNFYMIYPRADIELHDVSAKNIGFIFYDDFEERYLSDE